jgi:hypothetical protein
MIHADVATLIEQFDAIESDARALVNGLSEAEGRWRPAPSAWSVAECLDHLATANRVYLKAMRSPAERALNRGQTRRGPALPGVVGRWFVGWLEPPVKPRLKGKSPRAIRPRLEPSLADAFEAFLLSHEETRAFLQRFMDIDLARIRFPNPFIPGVRFSLATGVHVIAAHDRRHLWQAWSVRRQARQVAA